MPRLVYAQFIMLNCIGRENMSGHTFWEGPQLLAAPEVELHEALQLTESFGVSNSAQGRN